MSSIVAVFLVALGRSMRAAEPDQIFAELSVFPRYFVTGEMLQYRYSLFHSA